MQDISCRDCPWHDTRPSTNSVINTCPNCGDDQMVYTPHLVEVDPEPLPLPGPPIEVLPDPPTPPA